MILKIAELNAHVAQVSEIKNGKKCHINISMFSFFNMLHISDWSDYTPRMLRYKKHKARQMKKKSKSRSKQRLWRRKLKEIPFVKDEAKGKTAYSQSKEY